MVGLFESTPNFDPMTMLIKEVRLVASMVYNRSEAGADFDVALEILADRAAELAGLITHEFPLAEVQHGFEVSADKQSGAVKVLLDPTA